MSTKRRKKEAPKGQPRLNESRLNELVEEALGDAYEESEQATAFYTMLENDLQLSLSELPLPSPTPEGAEWIVAYRYWRTGTMG